jgi:hypothetical protein
VIVSFSLRLDVQAWHKRVGIHLVGTLENEYAFFELNFRSVCQVYGADGIVIAAQFDRIPIA